MAEWITLAAAAKASGYSPCGLAHLLDVGKIPTEYIKRTGKLWYIDAAAIPLIADYKERWHNTIEQPDNAIHVPDPNGIQAGLWLTPDEAQRLLAIREQHRRYPTAKERNKAIESDD